MAYSRAQTTSGTFQSCAASNCGLKGCQSTTFSYEEETSDLGIGLCLGLRRYQFHELAHNKGISLCGRP
ncbi:hypothetical protein ACET3Z_029185 [Daucus carota]